MNASGGWARSYEKSYACLVARKQVIVQLDDHLVAELDVAAQQDGISRSELIRRASLALLEARRITKLEQELRWAYERLPQDPVLVETARRLAAESAPNW
jgi:Arc/MetJ-type ribon-helix-helix transcriptional regulator